MDAITILTILKTGCLFWMFLMLLSKSDHPGVVGSGILAIILFGTLETIQNQLLVLNKSPKKKK